MDLERVDREDAAKKVAIATGTPSFQRYRSLVLVSDRVMCPYSR